MKKGMIFLGISFIAITINLITFSIGEGRRRQPSWMPEAKRVWKGERSQGELTKWENRLKKLRSWKKWPGVAICLNVIGVIHKFDGNPDEALRYFNESLEISRRHGIDPIIVKNLFQIGIVKKNKGIQKEAFESFKECMQIAKSIDFIEMEGRALVFMGSILFDMGRSKESMNYFEKAIPIAEKIQDNLLLMQCLNNMAKIYKNQGDYEKARDYFSRALKISRRAKNRIWTVFNLNGLGEVSDQQKNYPSALKYYQESIVLSEALNFKMGLATTYNKMGRIYLGMKDVKTALDYFEKSHAIARGAGMKPLVANTSKNIGKAYFRLGKKDEALHRLDEAIETLQSVYIPRVLQDCYHTKGRLLEQKGDLAGAEKNYKESVNILEGLREGVAGGEKEKLAFSEKSGQVYQRLIGLLLKQGKVAEAMRYLEQSRLKNLRDQFDQLNPNLGYMEEEKARLKEQELREQLERARVKLTEEQSKPREKQNIQKISQLEKRLNVKKQDYIEYINDLRENFPELASLLAIQPDTLIDLQSLLPPQAAIVQYLILKDRPYVFVVSSKTLLYKEVKVTQADLEGKIDYLRSLLMNPQIPLNMGPLEASTLRPKDEGKAALYQMFISPFFKTSEELHHLLIKPVEKELSSFRVLGIIPNGKLHLLPFQVLGEKNEKGEFRFLIEDKSIFKLNSQSILKFAQRRAREIGDRGRLIAFGNPDNSLKYAEEEIEMIKVLFPRSTTYIRNAASEDKIKTGLKNYDILHLATHGMMKGKIKESYVLLAGSADGREDGKLFLREIWGLSLRGYQLVTLSACETAVGKEASGDIMVSLETAFLRAGTPTILASLWEVDDQATGFLMKSFYQNLMTEGKANALRNAQVALMKNPRFAYPYYWAPFILVGDWR